MQYIEPTKFIIFMTFELHCDSVCLKVIGLKVFGYTFRGNNSTGWFFLLPFQLGQLLKKRICKFFPLRVDPISDGVTKVTCL